jgi:putative ABC transport system substrate-binding protein
MNVATRSGLGTFVKRREFMTLLGGAAVMPPIFWPPVARAQQSRSIRRIGWLSGLARPAMLESSQFGGFIQGMGELGYVEGRDFTIQWRFAESHPERYDALAAELAQQGVEVLIAGAPQVIPALQRAAPNVPIVVAISTDPVGLGFAQSLAHPGGNITGIANSVDDTAPKQLELLVGAIPNLSRLGVLGNSSGPNVVLIMKNLVPAARAVNISLTTADVGNADDFDGAFALLARERVDALIVISDVLFNVNRRRIAELAMKNRLPSMFSVREYVEAGGLMSYGESFREFFRRSAAFVDNILKGAKAGDLPFEQPNRFFFTVNLKTAKALGLELSPNLLARADEVIE